MPAIAQSQEAYPTKPLAREGYANHASGATCCFRCQATLTPINRHGKLGCKPCKRLYEKAHAYRWAAKKKIAAKRWRQANAATLALQRRSLRYGLSIEQYKRLVREQDAKCAICKQPQYAERLLCTDHDHGRGHVRGLLCVTCNTGLGAFQDNPALLVEAARYLVQREVAVA